MNTVSIQEAEARLAELIHKLKLGDEVVITEKNQPVARLISAAGQPQKKPRQPGTLRGTVTYMAPDFDAPLEDFKEYTLSPEGDGVTSSGRKSTQATYRWD